MKKKENQDILLSIAIPTWNRVALLDNALSNLLPQVAPLKDKIEIIISDNASSDDTREIISKWVKKYDKIKFNIFFQNENTGYFGNFKKCRELSSGKYFWLLSDNEYLLPDATFKIIKILDKNDIGILHLKNTQDKEIVKTLSFDKLIENYYHYLTFISASIMLNVKDDDATLFSRNKGNTFLGFVLLLNSTKFNTKAVVLEGQLYGSEDAEVTFNIFKSWTKDISDSLLYAKENKILDENQFNFLRKFFFEKIAVIHFYNYKLKGHLYGEKYGSIAHVYEKLNKYYGDLDSFYEITEKIVNIPRVLLVIEYYLKKIIKKIKKLFI